MTNGGWQRVSMPDGEARHSDIRPSTPQTPQMSILPSSRGRTGILTSTSCRAVRSHDHGDASWA